MKLTVGYITLNDSDWLLMSLDAVEELADEIIIIDGGSNPEHLKALDDFVYGRPKYKIIHNKYPGNNGTQYNQILKYATGDWILILDSDEIIGDNKANLRKYIENPTAEVYSIHMEHFFYSLAMADASVMGKPIFNPNSKHYVLCRLFKNKPGISFPEQEHVTIQGCGMPKNIDDVTIFHYGDAKQIMNWKKKYEMNCQRSNIHSRDYLDWWFLARLNGTYPLKPFDLKQHPQVIRENFYIGRLVK